MVSSFLYNRFETRLLGDENFRRNDFFIFTSPIFFNENNNPIKTINALSSDISCNNKKHYNNIIKIL